MMAQETGGRPRLLQAAIDAMRVPDLRGKIFFTFALLAVYRFIAHIPIPGVDQGELDRLFGGAGDTSALLGFLDIFSGGALRRLSVAALGVFPYITSSIVMQLLTPVVPRLQALSREGEAGRQQINRIVHFLTVPIALAQGYGQLLLLQQAGVVTSVGANMPTLAAVISLASGTMFLVWLGELITERGIGNGISLIIFAGIVSSIPSIVQQGFLNRDNTAGLVGFIVVVVLIVAFIVMFTEAHRRIPVQYGRSIFRGGRMYRQSGSSYLPIRVNSAGMIPLIFASSVVILPGTIASYLGTGEGWIGSTARFFQGAFSPANALYWVLTFLLVVIFTFFYTLVTFQQQNLAESLQRNGGFIPGIRPGQPTRDYLNRVIVRLTWGGALCLGFVAIVPFLASTVTNVQAIQLSSFSLLIMVGVALDTLRQLEAQLLMRNYEGFLR